jgi:hypothetical protein
MTKEHNVAMVRRAVEEVWNGGNLDLADRLFAPDYVNHGGLIPDLVRGPEAIKIGVALYRTAFPDLHIAVEDLVSDGATVVLRWTAHRVHPRGLRPAVPPSGEQVRKVTGTTRSRFVGDQIAESWTRWDRASALEHLGIALPEQPG